LVDARIANDTHLSVSTVELLESPFDINQKVMSPTFGEAEDLQSNTGDSPSPLSSLENESLHENWSTPATSTHTSDHNDFQFAQTRQSLGDFIHSILHSRFLNDSIDLCISLHISRNSGHEDDSNDAGSSPNSIQASNSANNAQSEPSKSLKRRSRANRSKFPGKDGDGDGDGDDSGDDDSEDDRDNKKPKRDPTPNVGRARKLVCPYVKRDPSRYADEHTCGGPGWSNVRRLK
jgi:hypothetical protein